MLELLGGDLITTSSMCLLDHTLADISSGEDYYYNALVFLTCQYFAAHSLSFSTTGKAGFSYLNTNFYCHFSHPTVRGPGLPWWLQKSLHLLQILICHPYRDLLYTLGYLKQHQTAILRHLHCFPSDQKYQPIPGAFILPPLLFLSSDSIHLI